MTDYIVLLDDLISYIVGYASAVPSLSYKYYALKLVLIHLRIARSLLDDLR